MTDSSVERVAVVGGGAVGLTAAFDLASAGVDVTLYERDELGSGSTNRAAGIVYDAFAEDVDVGIAERAVERFRDLSGEGNFRFDEVPYVWFATNAADADAIREQVSRMRHHDRDVETLDAAELRAAYPTLRTDDVEVAAVARTAGTADPAAYVDLLASKARAAGVDLRTGTAADLALDADSASADGPRVNGESYDAVVVAAGARTKRLFAEAGVSLPLSVYRAQVLRTRGPATPVVYDATDEFYFRPHPRGILAGDGIERDVSPADWDETADDDFVDATRERLADRLVNFTPDVEEAWAGLCTSTPDHDPLLGPVGSVAPGWYVAAGWEGHGFMRAPATGEHVADLVLGDAEPISPFDPRRFDSRTDCPQS